MQILQWIVQSCSLMSRLRDRITKNSKIIWHIWPQALPQFLHFHEQLISYSWRSRYDFLCFSTCIYWSGLIYCQVLQKIGLFQSVLFYTVQKTAHGCYVRYIAKGSPWYHCLIITLSIAVFRHVYWILGKEHHQHSGWLCWYPYSSVWSCSTNSKPARSCTRSHIIQKSTPSTKINFFESYWFLVPNQRFTHNSITHSLARSVTRSLARSLARSLTHSVHMHHEFVMLTIDDLFSTW